MAPRWISVALAALILLGPGCTAVGSLSIDSVSPSRISLGTAAQLLVVGNGFQRGDNVWLGSTPLGASVWVNDRLLSAPLPATVPPGRYDLAVVGSSGRRASKSGAIVVEAPAATATSTPAAPPPTPTARPTRQPTAPPSTPPPTEAATPIPTPTPTPTRTPTPTATAAARPAPAFDVSGNWNLVNTVQGSSGGPQGILYPDLVLSQAGSEVTGSGRGLSIYGVLTGHTLSGTYTASDGSTGELVWTFAADDRSFSGMFTNPGNRGRETGVSKGDLIHWASSGAGNSP